MVRLITSLSLTKELVKLIDYERGLIPRSAYIEFLLQRSLNKFNNGLQNSAEYAKK